MAETLAARNRSAGQGGGSAAGGAPRSPRHRWWLLACAILLAIALTVLMMFVADGHSAQPVGGPSGVHWTNELDEDFSGSTSDLLQSGTWHAGWFGDGRLTEPVNSLEKAIYSSDNLSVADGVARLDVRPNDAHLALRDGTTARNVGAAIDTDDQQAAHGFTFSYGYVEARMQLPAGSAAEGLWPSFWLNGQDWPDDMEVDVVEGDGTDQGCKFNIHYGHGEDTTNLNDVNRSHAVPGATSGMHTYAADVRPDGITFYYDGAAVYSYTGTVPDKQRYVMVGLSSSKRVTSTKSLLVDHVRVWTRS